MDEMHASDSVTIARIDERTQAQTIALAAHAATLAGHVKEDAVNRAEDNKASDEKFDKVFNFVSKLSDKMDERFDKIEEKLLPLQNESNQRKGASGVAKLLTSGAYAMIALAAGYFGGRHS